MNGPLRIPSKWTAIRLGLVAGTASAGVRLLPPKLRRALAEAKAEMGLESTSGPHALRSLLVAVEDYAAEWALQAELVHPSRSVDISGRRVDTDGTAAHTHNEGSTA